MNASLLDLYLDLLKKSLSYSLWQEPGVPVDAYASRKRAPKRLFLRALSGALGRLGYQLVKPVHYSPEQRETGQIWPMQADTMIGMRRLENIRQCVETVLADNVPGDLIETGVWRGGASIFMKAVLEAHGATGRRLFVADSFQGLPPPELERFPQDRGDKLHKFDFLAVSQEQVEENFRKYGLLDESVVFLKGWFKDTLPAAPIERLALIRLDGDMYSSTMDALGALYPKLSPGGFCIIDDYNLKTCREATVDYRRSNGITSPIQAIDGQGVFWRK